MEDHYASEWHLDALLRLCSGTCSTYPSAWGCAHGGAAAGAGAVAPAGPGAVAPAELLLWQLFCCGSFCCWHSLGRHGWQGVPKLKGPQAAWQAMAATL